MMFYDERIENERGKISRNALIFTVIVSLVSGTTHILSMWGTKEFELLLLSAVLEPAVVLVGGVALIIGAIIGIICRKDERTVFLQNRFFTRSAPIALMIVFGVYAILLPINIVFGFQSYVGIMEFEYFFNEMLFMVLLYVVYSFKNKEIYFNYSIIDDTHYYKKVWQRIGRFALTVMGYFALSFLTVCFFMVAFKMSGEEAGAALMKMLIKYSVTIIVISLTYLLWSYLEKASYIRESGTPKSSLILMTVAVAAALVYNVIVFCIHSLGMSESDTLITINRLRSMPFLIEFCLFVIFMYFSYEYNKRKASRMIKASCNILWIKRLVCFAGSVLSLSFGYLIRYNFSEISGNAFLWSSVGYVMITIKCIEYFMMALMVDTVVITLIADKKINIVNIAFIIVVHIVTGAGIIFSLAGGSGIIERYYPVLCLVIYAHLCFIAFRIFSQTDVEEPCE